MSNELAELKKKNPENIEDDGPIEFDPECDEQVDWGYLEPASDPDAEGKNKKTFVTQYLETDIPQYTPKMLLSYLQEAYDLSQPMLVYGDPGIGKSSIVRLYAEQQAKAKGKEFFLWHDNRTNIDLGKKQKVLANPEKYFVFIDIRAAQLNPEDLVGIPDITSKEEFLTMKQPKWIWYLSNAEADGILFLDELNQGSEHVLKALFQLVLDRQVAGTQLSRHFSIVSAGNIGGQYNQPIPIALTNRFRVGVLGADSGEWLEWAKEKDENGKKRVDDSIINFVTADPTTNFIAKQDKDPNNPFVTPRSLVSLSKAVDKIKNDYLQAKKNHRPMPASIYKVIGDTAAQLCGVVWARKFIIYLQYIAAFRWDEIIVKTKEFKSDYDASKKWAAIEFIVRKLVYASSPKLYQSAQSKKQFEETINFLLNINMEYATWMVKYFNQDNHERFLTFFDFAHSGKYNEKSKKAFNDDLFKKIGEIVKKSN